MKQKYNLVYLISGIVMIIASAVNYSFSEDFVSLGIFVFSGLGFIFMSIKKETKKDRERMIKFANIMFTVAVIIFVYWLIAGKLKIIQI